MVEQHQSSAPLFHPGACEYIFPVKSSGVGGEDFPSARCNLCRRQDLCFAAVGHHLLFRHLPLAVGATSCFGCPHGGWVMAWDVLKERLVELCPVPAWRPSPARGKQRRRARGVLAASRNAWSTTLMQFWNLLARPLPFLFLPNAPHAPELPLLVAPLIVPPHRGVPLEQPKEEPGHRVPAVLRLGVLILVVVVAVLARGYALGEELIGGAEGVLLRERSGGRLLLRPGSGGGGAASSWVGGRGGARCYRASRRQVPRAPRPGTRSCGTSVGWGARMGQR